MRGSRIWTSVSRPLKPFEHRNALILVLSSQDQSRRTEGTLVNKVERVVDGIGRKGRSEKNIDFLKSSNDQDNGGPLFLVVYIYVIGAA